MALSEFEKQKVDKIVGGFCQTRVPPHAQHQIKMIYKIRGNEVKIIETRPHFQNKDIWTETPIARLKYEPESMKWEIFWLRSNGKWILYEEFAATHDLKKVVEEIDHDPYHVFWE